MYKVSTRFLFLLLFFTLVKLEAQWETTDFSTNSSIHQLYVFDDMVFVPAFIENTLSTRLHLSVDNGENFTERNSPSSFVNCMELHDGKLFLGSGWGIYASSDSGGSWVPKNNGFEKPANFQSLHSANGYLYAGLGENRKIYRSSDTGDSWTLLDSSDVYSENVTQIEVCDSAMYILVGSQDIYKSTDNGSSWESKLNMYNINGFVANASGSTIFVARLTYRGGVGLLYSTDYGENFIEDSTFDQVDVTSIHYSNGTYFIGTYRSENGSRIMYKNASTNDTWVDKSEELYSFASSLQSTNDYLLAAHGDSIISRRKMSDFGITTDIKDDEVIPTNFVLNQNYPNPFNPSTTISYSIPKQSNVSLKVYDVLGKEISELVNTEKAAGDYDVQFDASGLSSGVYFYQLEADSYTVRRKMILIK